MKNGKKNKKQLFKKITIITLTLIMLASMVIGSVASMGFF